VTKRTGHNIWLLFFSLVFVFVAISGCSKTPKNLNAKNNSATSPTYTIYTIVIESLPTIGDYLTDQSGMTLYYNTNDSADQSSINGSMLLDWPVFYAAAISVQPPLRKTDFGTILRLDGKYQTTYKGWPLYYSSMDSEPSDSLGQGVGGVWSIAGVNIPAAKSSMSIK
jgi:predicted lipoprotein with Yx(FWY)xxD motif